MSFLTPGMLTVGQMREILSGYPADVPITVEHMTDVVSDRNECTVVVGILPDAVSALTDEQGELYLVIGVTDEDELNRQGARLG